MKRGPVLVLTLALLLWASALHAAPDAIVRTALSKPTSHVGETITLELTILVPGWFSGPVALPASPEVAGAQVRLSETAGANVNEVIDGIPYAGIRRHYTVIPQRAGRLEIPSLRLDVPFADGERKVKTALRSQAQVLQASIPVGMEHLGYFIASPRYRLQQRLDRPLENLRVGDAVVRTLVQSADEMPAVQLPILRQSPLDGVTAYADDPVFEDRRGERGTPDVAMQTQRITYLLERPGDYVFPALEIRWLNTRSGKLESRRLPALALNVSANPDSPSGEPDDATPSESFPEKPQRPLADSIHWAWAAGILSILAWFVLRIRRLRAERECCLVSVRHLSRSAAPARR